MAQATAPILDSTLTDVELAHYHVANRGEADISQLSRDVGRRFPGQETVRHRQSAKLIRLQGNLLSEHDIARDEITNGHKAPANSGATSGVDLMYVRHGAVVNTISASTVATDDIEISVGVELGTLLGR